MLSRVSDNENADKKVKLPLDSAHNVLAVVGLEEVRKFSRNSPRKSLHKVPLCNVLHRRRKKSLADFNICIPDTSRRVAFESSQSHSCDDFFVVDAELGDKQ